MPRRAKGLTATFVRKAEPGRYANGANLYLFVRGPQVKFWLFRYVRNGRMREMGLSPATGPVAVSSAEARARANLSAMYTWAIGEGLRDANPVAGTNNPADSLKARTRVLSDAELRAVWEAADDGDFGRIVKLLILTGARRQEIGSVRWQDIDPDTGVLTIPAERAKNGHTLELPLPPAALEILNSTKRRGDHVFGAAGTGFTSWSIATAAFRRRITKPMADWRLHDIRRSMRTGLGRIGVPPHIAELLINHVKGGVEAIYDWYSYDGEKRAALARWADYVLAVVEGRAAKVVPLGERRA